MPSATYTKFVDSMVVDYYKWHDGDGYDLDAMLALDPAERLNVEELLLDHLQHKADWRDVEALQALGTPRALEAVKGALHSSNPEVRAAAVRETLAANPEEPQPVVEESLVQGIKQARSLDQLSRLLDQAPSCPTPLVKKALLDCARLGDPEMRVNAAAMLMFLCGQAAEPFDWAQRPFFLQFRAETTTELRVCWEELCRRTGV